MAEFKDAPEFLRKSLEKLIPSENRLDQPKAQALFDLQEIAENMFCVCCNIAYHNSVRHICPSKARGK